MVRDTRYTSSVGVDEWEENLATDVVSDGLCMAFGCAVSDRNSNEISCVII